jgi:hypothetical protein
MRSTADRGRVQGGGCVDAADGWPSWRWHARPIAVQASAVDGALLKTGQLTRRSTLRCKRRNPVPLSRREYERRSSPPIPEDQKSVGPNKKSVYRLNNSGYLPTTINPAELGDSVCAGPRSLFIAFGVTACLSYRILMDCLNSGSLTSSAPGSPSHSLALP